MSECGNINYMSIENIPNRESVVIPTAKFERFSPDILRSKWEAVIGSESKIVREKIIKYGDEPPISKKEKLNNFGIVYEEDIAVLHWRNEDGKFKHLPVNKDFFVGVEENLDTSEKAVVLKYYRIDDEGNIKQTIRKFSKDE